MSKSSNKVQIKQGGGGDAVYGIGVIGALFYYVGQVDGLLNIIIAIIKAFLWPAFVVYDLLKFLG
jgi:hypothetical protein